MVCALLVSLPAIVGAQEPPPIAGVTGTLALEGTIEKTYDAATTVIVKATDGIEHLFHLAKGTVVHAANGADAALNGVSEGSRVVVHYAVDGGEKTAVEVDRIGEDGLRETRGVVTRVDRDAKELSIRLDDGSTETLHLSERAARTVGLDVHDAATVVVYYVDEDGKKVAHYFKKILAD